MDQIERIAGYPVRVVTVDVGSLAVRLFVVHRLEDYVDTQALLADAEAAEPPYWAHLWTGARALARRIATDIDCRGKRVVDIGCGLGLTAIVAAKRGALVQAFDLDPAGVAIARANAALNDCTIDIRQADVRTLQLAASVDCGFAADITYDPTLQIAVADFLYRHLDAGGRAWCAESVRTVDTGFRRACEERGLVVREDEAREHDEGRAVIVRIAEVAAPMTRDVDHAGSTADSD